MFEINGIAVGLVAVNSLHFINAVCGVAVAIEQQYDQVTVENSEFGALGIFVNEQFVAGATVTIGNNRFFGAGAGVSVQNAANVTIHDNLLEGTGSINVGGTSQATLERNTFTRCGGGPACIIVGGQPSASVTVRDNQLTVDISQQIPSGMLVNLGNHIITGNVITGVGSNPGAPTVEQRYPFTLAGIEVVDGAIAEVSNNAVTNVFIGLQFGFNVTATGTDNVVDNVAFGVQSFESANLTFTSSDFTNYGVPLQLGQGAPKDFTCNWWGSVLGPVDIQQSGIDPDVFTPWATAPVAGTSATECSGGPPIQVRVAPADVGTDPLAFATVAEALSVVASGGTIKIADGPHAVQDVQVNKPVTIEAEGPGVPVLDGTGGVRGFDVGGSPGITSGAGAVTIRGLSFQNMFETGIHVTGNYDLVVVENSVFFPSTNGLASGVFVSGANGNGITIQGNTFTGGAVGVHVGTTPGVLVLDNGFDNQGTNPVRGPIELMQGNTITRCHGQCVEVAGFAGSSLTVIDNSWTVDISDPIVAALNIDEGALADAVVIEDNSVIGIGGTHDPSIAETFPMHFAGININTGSVELSRNTVEGAFHAIVFNNVGTVTASDNTIDGVNVAWQAFGSVGSGSIHSNDITNFGVPFQGPGFTPGSLTCNWWGSVFGPDPGPGPDPDIFTPWATAPIANSAGGLCDGTP